jgi:Amino acid permease
VVRAAILLALGVAYLVQGHHPAAPMTARHLLPAWTGLASIVLIVNSFFTYAGVEVNAVHVNELRNPGREYPRSIFLAMALVLAVFIGPTLAISWVIPSARISFTVGVMQAFNGLFTHFGLGFAVPLIAIALAVGALAGMISWLDGPSEGLLLIGRKHGYLPPYFQKGNRYGIGVRIIATEGVVITLIALLYAFIPSVSHAFWIFTALATQVYLIMYVLMFVAAIRLRRSQPDRPRGYRAGPGPAVPARHRLGCGRVRNRVHPAVAVQSFAPAQVHPGDPGRDPRHRRCSPAADGPPPQTQLAGSRRRLSPINQKDLFTERSVVPLAEPLRAHPATGLRDGRRRWPIRVFMRWRRSCVGMRRRKSPKTAASGWGALVAGACPR